jgi:hypothetical protein
MPGGWGLRSGSRPRLLGALAGVALLVALVVTGRLLSGPGLRPPADPPTATASAPYRAGERPACPHAVPVLATADGRYHPPGHPTPPPRDAAAVACYGTAAAATAAGYAEAPLPAGALDLGGVYLVRVPDGVRGECRRAAGRLGFPVPCPRLRPVPSLGEPPPAVCPPPCGRPGFGFVFEDSGFVVPSGYVGAYPEVGRRLVVAAARRPVAGAVACPGERPVSRPQVRGYRAGLFRCPSGTSVHHDGLLLRWREGGVVIALSVTGQATERRLVLALAASLELVPAGR